jgi:hypothetical protein
MHAALPLYRSSLAIGRFPARDPAACGVEKVEKGEGRRSAQAFFVLAGSRHFLPCMPGIFGMGDYKVARSVPQRADSRSTPATATTPIFARNVSGAATAWRGG